MKLTDEQILALWSGSAEALRPVLGSKKVLTFAREVEAAVLAQGEPCGWFDPQTGDYSRVNRIGWSEMYLHPAPVNTAQSDDAILRAWQAGYYEAGYTHDQAYADKMAREYLEATKK